MTDKKIFEEHMQVLKPGEHIATKGESILGTVTGSSVVVCLYDRNRAIGGMGHFIVPGTIGTEGIVADEIARTGVANMEYLMGEIVKLGGDRRALKAKVYGSSMIHGDDERIGDALMGNLQFIEQYFTLEKIPIEEGDLGSGGRQKILFSPATGEVRKSPIAEEDAALFVRLEKEYIERVFREKGKTGGVVIFD